MSMDNVYCSPCEGFSTPDFYNDEEPIDSFIAATYRNLPGTELWQLMKAGKFQLSGYQQSSNGQLVSYIVKFTNFSKFNDNKYELYHNFEFINVNGKLKFNGIRSGWLSRKQHK
ncbi:MAG TPA: hypothetical protein VFP97_14195 [Chitinophagaceae bacterium]|nr:hypothetical protein [Chitinophagaceae bacterium]